MLNAVEYHRSSEINIAVTDLILLLGCEQDIEEDYSYDTSKIKAFLVPAGTGIEVYATTFHYAPCKAKGDIIPGQITFFRLQSNAEAEIIAYTAEGEVLPVATRSFGSIGIFAISEMGRFYRHVLIEKRYPHHGAVAFGHYGRAIYNLFKYLGVSNKLNCI